MATALITDIITRAQQLANRVDVRYRDRLIGSIDRNVQLWAKRLPWPALRREETFVANGTGFLTFPDRVGTIIRFLDETNQRNVMAGANFWERAPGPMTSRTAGSPFEWQPAGTQPVISQPASAAQLELTAGASETYDVRVVGLIEDTEASGTPLQYRKLEESLTMGGTGTTETVNSFTEILSLEKAKETTGELRVDIKGGDTIAYISPAEARAEYQRVQFLFAPQAGTLLRTEYYTKPERIVAETQVLDNGVDQDFIAWRAAGDLHWMNKEGQAAQLAWQKADEIMAAAIQSQKTFGQRCEQAYPTIPYTALEDANDDLLL